MTIQALKNISLRISSGGTPSRRHSEYFSKESGHLWVKSKELLDSGISSTEEKITDDALNNSSAKYFPEHSVLIAMYGANVGQLGWLRNPATVNQAVCGLVIDPEKADWRYVFYALLQNRDNLTVQARGAAQQNLNQDLIKSFEIPFLSLDDQHLVSDVLSAYDDLIENNTRRIQILEQLAQAIYIEWFVNFHFPDHEKVKMTDSDTDFGKIPKEWEVKKVEDLIERISPGKLYDNKTVSKKGLVPVLDQGRSGIIGYYNDVPGVEASIEKPVIVFANHTCYQRLMFFSFSAIQNVLPFYPLAENYRNIFWLHWATKDVISFNDYKGHWPEFMQKKVVVPTAEMAERFAEIIKPLKILSYQLELANKNLRQPRDLLLPKLVTGEIRV